MNWKMAMNYWRFGYGRIIDMGTTYQFHWSESTETPTIDWSSLDAIEAQTALKNISEAIK